MAWLLVISACSARAEKHANELDLKIERVIVFKDGYSLIIKRGTATVDEQGEVFTEDVINTWIWYKREKEVRAIQHRPHPYEFMLYYDV